MRHRRKRNKLSREKSHRELLIKGMVGDLIKHEKIKTTHRKAQIIQSEFDKLMQVTFSDSEAHIKKQRLHQYLNNKEAEKKALADLSKRYKERKTGLTRIIKLGFRKGDSAPLSQIELV